jgi:hypothetical protein
MTTKPNNDELMELIQLRGEIRDVKQELTELKSALTDWKGYREPIRTVSKGVLLGAVLVFGLATAAGFVLSTLAIVSRGFIGPMLDNLING